jgi:phosphatidylinositol-3-phosphatase
MRKGWLVHKILFNILVLFSLGAAEIGCGGGSADPSSSSPACPICTVAGKGTIPVVSHVFVLVGENHAYSSVIGNPAMPYTNGLAQRYALATQYYADRHNSLPNYFMLTVGNLITTDDLYTGTVTSDNVVRALTNAGKSWKIYAENLPSVGYLGPSIIPYAKDHNPFSYFSDVLNSSSQAANIVPVTQLATDLQNGTLPDYAMIVPDLANDGHDCPNEAASCTDTQILANVDNWIQTNIGPLINSSAFQNSLLVYTWDESVITDLTNQGGHVATILVSPRVKAGYQSTTMYQHQSTLKLTMQLLGVTDYPGLAASAPDMTEFF